MCFFVAAALFSGGALLASALASPDTAALLSFLRSVVASIVYNQIFERSDTGVVSTALAGVRIIAVSSLVVEEDHWEEELTRVSEEIK